MPLVEPIRNEHEVGTLPSRKRMGRKGVRGKKSSFLPLGHFKVEVPGYLPLLDLTSTVPLASQNRQVGSVSESNLPPVPPPTFLIKSSSSQAEVPRTVAIIAPFFLFLAIIIIIIIYFFFSPHHLFHHLLHHLLYYLVLTKLPVG